MEVGPFWNRLGQVSKLLGAQVGISDRVPVQEALWRGDDLGTVGSCKSNQALSSLVVGRPISLHPLENDASNTNGVDRRLSLLGFDPGHVAQACEEDHSQDPAATASSHLSCPRTYWTQAAVSPWMASFENQCRRNSGYANRSNDAIATPTSAAL